MVVLNKNSSCILRLLRCLFRITVRGVIFSSYVISESLSFITGHTAYLPPPLLDFFPLSILFLSPSLQPTPILFYSPLSSPFPLLTLSLPSSPLSLEPPPPLPSSRPLPPLDPQGSWHEEIQRHMSKLMTDKIPTDNDLIMQRERELK